MVNQATVETDRTIHIVEETEGVERMNGKNEVKALAVLSPDGCEAIDRVIEFADSGLAKYKVYLKYIVDIDPIAELYFKDGQFDRLRKEGQEIVDPQITRLRNCGVDVEVLPFHFGIAAEEILRTEKQIQPDIIVVGSSRTSTVRRLLWGGICEDMVRQAKTPVLIVRSNGAVSPRSHRKAAVGHYV